jgi:hypothetical protein
VLAADADFEIRARLAAACGGDAHQLANPLLINRDEGIALKYPLLCIVFKNGRCIITRKAKAGLREVIGAE